MLATLLCLIGLTLTHTNGLTAEQNFTFEEEVSYEEKLIRAFKYLDVNKDGVLSKDDCTSFANKICSLSDTTDEDSAYTRKQWEKWYDGTGADNNDSLKHFVQAYVQMMDAFPDMMWKENVDIFRDVFDKLDSDKDGLGSPEEIRLFYEVIAGFGDEYDIDDVFQSTDENGDNHVSRDAFAFASAAYWSPRPGPHKNFLNPKKKT